MLTREAGETAVAAVAAGRPLPVFVWTYGGGLLFRTLEGAPERFDAAADAAVTCPNGMSLPLGYRSPYRGARVAV
jgi:hypothetical protein